MAIGVVRLLPAVMLVTVAWTGAGRVWPPRMAMASESGAPAVRLGPDLAEASGQYAPLPVPPRPPIHMTEEERAAEWKNSQAPYFDVPPFEMSTIARQNALAKTEAPLTPDVYAGSVAFRRDHVPLPPGRWTVVSVARDLERPSSGIGMLMARLDGHDVTGFVLVRHGPFPGGTPVANPMCAYPRRYARLVVRPFSKQGEECWFIAEATFPHLTWDMVLDPLALPVALKTMAADGRQFPTVMVRGTFYASTGHGWRETTYFFDPLANGAPEGGPFGGWAPAVAMTDPRMQHFAGRYAAWMTAMQPLLEHPEAVPSSATVDRANTGAPE
ncbi:hypothetical protein [Lichenicola sp.]|uniref:hypothetical protein n=1 Tax=Lichenicola sp. TaxID=2804529 RepID=UPI003AFFA69F